MATAPFVLIIEPGLTATFASSGSKIRKCNNYLSICQMIFKKRKKKDIVYANF